MELRSKFEADYTKQVNMLSLGLLAVHLPVICIIAWVFGNSVWLALWVSILLLAGPAFVIFQDNGSHLAASVVAFSAMGFCALTIHLCNGMIEAHFEIFVILAALIVFGRVAPLIVGGATVALHHVIFWLWLPASVFNYKASFYIVLVHAFYVVAEVIPACWIAVHFGKSIHVQSVVADHLSDTAEQIAISCQEIGRSSDHLAGSASTHAGALHKTVTASQELNVTAEKNAEMSEASLGLMKTVDQQMYQANSELEIVRDSVNEIVSSSKKIGDVIKLIEGIAFQTNILALNAAVEAARAGEYGAGFAVVADEVRSLAQRSAHAATDTAELIETSLASTRKGEQSVQALGSTMSRVTEATHSVSSQIKTVYSTAQSQRGAFEQISQALRQMENVSQQSAAGAEESAAVGATLTEQAQRLREIVTQMA